MNSHYHNNSYTAKALLSLLIICGVISITATAVFLLSKQPNARQDRIVGAPTPELSPLEHELESFPHESIALATSVHYGERPHLKSKLFSQSVEVNLSRSIA